MFFFTFKAELSQLVPIQLDLPFLSLGWIHPSLNQSRFFITIFHSNSIVKKSSVHDAFTIFWGHPLATPSLVTRRSNSSRAAAIRRRASARATWARLGRGPGPGGPGPRPGPRSAGSSEPRLGASPKTMARYVNREKNIFFPWKII